MQKKFDWYPTKTNIEKITLDEAKFIFEQAEKLLQQVINSSNIIISRTTTLISIAIALMVALTGYSFTKYQSNSLHDPLFISSVYGSVYLFVLCFLLVLNIKSKDYSMTGANPKDLLNNSIFVFDSEHDKRIITLYANEITNYQEKIRKNIQTNKNRWSLFNWTLYLMICTPIVMLLAYHFS